VGASGWQVGPIQRVPRQIKKYAKRDKTRLTATHDALYLAQRREYACRVGTKGSYAGEVKAMAWFMPGPPLDLKNRWDDRARQVGNPSDAHVEQT
jgi:hypothetical protein